ncbi:reverse transcriptase domain-containing protein [Dyadobacter sediminis]|uniref:reverse transcriptase domain-containing protein n=1 Tax=Dyadobacter sediminis TaxID=1493691 RepID=UPI0016646E23|nr:reverse transcriptase domain-containing protein [Dyadobacter sediminis]GGB87699.1 hypothetical protein GCM10011325_14090 [Dyadobacter sediminis]
MSIQIKHRDLTTAYRKAKADAYYENGHHNALNFAIYETNLEENLTKLRDYFLNWEVNDLDDFVGSFALIMKDCVEVEKNEPVDSSFVFISDLKRNWRQQEELKVDFRIIGQHPVEFHILSSLWIDKVGVYLDEVISPSSYGCRLKRTGQSDYIELDEKPRAKPSGHYRPYFTDYQKWQQNGIKEIQKSIQSGKKVIAITADIKKFYHRIDINFLLNESFQEISNFNWTKEQLILTKMLCRAINVWNDKILLNNDVPKEYKHKNLAGIPLGLGASKVVANALLSFLDRQISQELLPIFYGRYVDDIFLVIEDNGKILTSQDFWNFISKRIEYLDVSYKDDEGPILNIPYGERSFIEFGKGKEKLFMLEGSSGASFIEALKTSLDENSSEWKMLPDMEEDLENFTKEMAKPTYNFQEPANGLRKADGISIQRLKFALQLRNFETVINLVPKKLWINGLNNFFSIAKDFVLASVKIGTFSRYFPRLIRIAISAGEPNLAIDLLNEINSVWESLQKKVAQNKIHFLKKAAEYNESLLTEAVYSSLDPSKLKIYKKKEWKKLFDLVGIKLSDLTEKADLLFLADLHIIPYRRIFFEKELRVLYWDRLDDDYALSYISMDEESRYFKSIDFTSYDKFIKTLLGSHPIYGSILPKALYFYVRPFSSLELTYLLPTWAETTDQIKSFKEFQNLFNIPPITVSSDLYNKDFDKSPFQQPPLTLVEIPEKFKSVNRVMALASFKTTDDSWKAWVREDNNEPDNERYSRLFKLLNEILKSRKNDIQYLVFPELSIPRNLLLFIAGKLKTKGISLIAGVEYKRGHKKEGISYSPDTNGILSNQLVYILTTRTEYSYDQVMLVQEKTIAAIHEERELYEVGGKILVADSKTKYLINHDGFIFSGLICNDILNLDNRYILRGLIDALIVVEWNRDIETYDSIIVSTSNDLHCFVVQVNNRLYGDTRIRAPYKESYQRDLVRLRGGELDYFVVSTIDVESLREFQRYHRSPDKPFKPIPTGFKMSAVRRKISK